MDVFDFAYGMLEYFNIGNIEDSRGEIDWAKADELIEQKLKAKKKVYVLTSPDFEYGHFIFEGLFTNLEDIYNYAKEHYSSWNYFMIQNNQIYGCLEKDVVTTTLYYIKEYEV